MTRRPAVALLALPLALAGCGARAIPPPAAASGELRVGLTEFEIVAAPAVARAGTVTLTVTNAGAAAHDLVVSREDRPTERLPIISPGATATLAVAAVAGGQLRLWCSLPGHRAQGMELAVPVRREA